MKKNFFYIFGLLLFVSNLHGQKIFSNVENYTKTTKITYVKCTADSLDFSRTGDRVTWGFLRLNCDGDTINLNIERPDSLARAEFPEANLLEKNANGSIKAYRKGGGRTFLMGYYDTKTGAKIDYKESLLQSRRPVSYRDKVAKKYESVFSKKDQEELKASGNVSLEADGVGTLLLPNRILENALRIKHEQTQEVAVEKYDTIHKTQQNTYMWFDDYQKSPVLKVTEVVSGDEKRQEILFLVREREEWRIFR